MAKHNKDYDIQDELNFDEDVDSYQENVDPEVSLVNTILNEGEEAARSRFGDDKVDRALSRNHLARTYNPKI